MLIQIIEHNICKRAAYDGRIDVVLGLDYENVEGIVSKYESNPLIQIYRNVSNFSEFIFKADLIFTSPNKSMYEICSIGVPTICLCKDDRDVSHVFANNNNGFINMGRGEDLGRQDVVEEFARVVNDFDLSRHGKITQTLSTPFFIH